MPEETSELNSREKFHADLYRDPEVFFRRGLRRRLGIIIPSVLLMIVWVVSKDPAYAYFGYGLLLYQSVLGIFQMRRGIQTTNSVLKKYQSKLQKTSSGL